MAVQSDTTPSNSGFGLPAIVAVCATMITGCGALKTSDPETPKATTDPMVVPASIEVQGHRGARGLRPENTLPAFEHALDLGVDVLELDLHLSSDDVVVVWHDPVISVGKCRVSEGLPDPAVLPDDDPALRVRNLSADQLSRYACDRNPDPGRFPTQRSERDGIAAGRYGIVSLDALFEFVESYAADPAKTDRQRERAKTIRFNIETKRVADDPTAIGDDFDGVEAGTFEKEVVKVIEARALGARTVLQSFDHRSLWALHKLAPTIRLAALTEEPMALGPLAKNGAAIWSPSSRLVDAETLAEARKVGLRVIPWTVNDTTEARRLVKLGVDGIITDRPDLIRAAE